MRTDAAHGHLERLVRVGLAGPGSVEALRALAARCSACREVIFELVLGDGHPGEVDLGLRLRVEDVAAVLSGEPGLPDWHELLFLGPAGAWVERDTGRPDAPLSVFAQFGHDLHRSAVRRALRRLGGPSVPLPAGQVRHLGVLHGRAAREIRIVYEASDLGALAAEVGLTLPSAPPGRVHLALGLGDEGWLMRRGAEWISRRAATLPPLEVTEAQRAILDGWTQHAGCAISHLKWVEPDRVVKAYLSVR